MSLKSLSRVVSTNKLAPDWLHNQKPGLLQVDTILDMTTTHKFPLLGGPGPVAEAGLLHLQDKNGDKEQTEEVTNRVGEVHPPWVEGGPGMRPRGRVP